VRCRHCSAEVSLPFVDLATAPPSNSYLLATQLARPETWYPLQVLVCQRCWLVQTRDYAHREELFSGDYAYFSSYSTTWLRHAGCFVEEVVERFGLHSDSLVIEVAANDGYLLQYVRERNIPCIGIEPTASTAEACRGKGIEVVQEFFGTELAERLAGRGLGADLMVANNVLAHVPNINDFAAGFARLLKADGVATFEFPHLLRLVQQCQFDTVYHEHFSYLSLTSVSTILHSAGLGVFAVEELTTHGGSLRVYAQRLDTGARPVMPGVTALLRAEHDAGVDSERLYLGFQARVDRMKHALLAFLLEAKRAGRIVGAYGAAAKGNTLLNYAGIRGDLIPWVVDRNPAKVGKFMPGSRIPIVSEDRLRRDRPAYVLILPWNLKAELVAQLDYIRAWGGRCAVAVPDLEVEP
jgi:hypothetical protein